MALARDLLDQATHLARLDTESPKPANLRRAVSAAYYALFHLLSEDSAISAAPITPPGLRELVRRAFSHADMKAVCRGFVDRNAAFLKSPADRRPVQTGQIPLFTDLLTFPLEPDLVLVMKTFGELQIKRHAADYDMLSTWERREVLNDIEAARIAFAAWDSTKDTPNAAVFKAALLFQKRRPR